MASPPADSWESLWRDVGRLRGAVRRQSAEKVSANATRDSARQIVQAYFRAVRLDLTTLGLDLSATDSLMQGLLGLAAGQSRKTARRELEIKRELRLGERAADFRRETTETSILETLRRMVPKAAVCYEQALSDLAATRESYRGTAAELRATVAEVMDHLAPDDLVAGSPGFKFEEGQKQPTMRQKARFILKARGQEENARKVVEDSVSVVDEYKAGAARATQQRASISVHDGAGIDEVRQLKRYVDTVLCELLEIR